MAYPIISADSHITEPPNTYVDFIDPAFRERAPRMERVEGRGDVFVVDGMSRPIDIGLAAAAGKPPEELKVNGVPFEELHRGGWDPAARLGDQARDGVAAEIIYPTVGMVLCNHRDFDYKKACFDAYNRWLAPWCAHAPNRLIGVGQTAMRSPEEGITDLESIAALGLRGVMLPGEPAVEDYDHAVYDPFWEAAVEIGLPVSFHILTGGAGGIASGAYRGPKMNSFLGIIRGNQDLVGTLIFGAVFDRHPGLRIVCVEADAGWAPHWMYRADHAFHRHRNWLGSGDLARLPSEYFREHVYLTFQDDWVAFRMLDMVNPDRLLWANDHPHSDSTWPNSQDLLVEQTAHMTDEQRGRILRRSTAELYGIALPPTSPGESRFAP